MSDPNSTEMETLRIEDSEDAPQVGGSGHEVDDDVHSRIPPNRLCPGWSAEKRNKVLLGIAAGVLLFIVLIVGITHNAKKSDDAAPPQKSNAMDYKNSLRLPSYFQPDHYAVHLWPNLTNFKYTGSVSVSLRVTEAVSVVFLHAHSSLVIANPTLTPEGGSSLSIGDTFFYEPHQFYVLKLSAQAGPGRYTLSMDFSGELDDSLAGFYRSGYTDSSDNKHWIATTQFEPTDARKAFPCFDEPGYKANFTISMVRQPGLVALSNMPIDTVTQPTSGTLKEWGLETVKFKTSVRMSTYLVAFVLCDFEKISTTTASGIKVSVHTPAEELHMASYSLQVAAEVIDYYQTFFGLPYPLEKVDMCAIPDFAAGAMENWGLITYRQVDLLYNEKSSAASNKQRVAIVVAHELAHQWFGNLVTMRWWSDLWLNEGFASFTEYVGTDHVAPEWRMWDQLLIYAQQSALQLDSLRSSHPIHVEVNNPNEINEIFDSISYDKGGSVLEMMRSFLGTSVFRAGLLHYLSLHKFDNAETSDLWQAMTTTVRNTPGTSSFWNSVTVNQVMDTWTQQKDYPMIRFDTSSPNTLKLTQFPFHLAKLPPGSGDDKAKWYVPLTYWCEKGCAGKPAGDAATTWLTPTDDALLAWTLSSNGFIKINANQRGFYRVLYPETHWPVISKAMAEQLSGEHKAFNLTVSDRAGMLDDAFNFARAGHIPYALALDFTSFLYHEDSFVVWATAVREFAFLRQRLRTKSYYGQLEQYVRDTFSEVLKKTRWGDRVLNDQTTASRVTLRMKVDLGSLPAGTAARRTFLKDATTDFAKALGVSTERLQLAVEGSAGAGLTLMSLHVYPSKSLAVSSTDLASAIAARFIAMIGDSNSALMQSTKGKLIDNTFSTASQSLSAPASTDHLTELRRNWIIDTALVYNHQPTLQEAAERFQALMAACEEQGKLGLDVEIPLQQPSQSGAANFTIHPDVIEQVLTAGVMQGGLKEWDFVWSLYSTASVSIRRSILKALSRTRTPWLLSRYITFSLDQSKIRRQDAAYVIQYTAQTVLGERVAWEFVQSQWDTLAHASESFGTSRIIRGVASHFSTQSMYNEVKTFFDSGSRKGKWRSTVLATLESIQANMDWVTDNEAAILSWLQTQST